MTVNMLGRDAQCCYGSTYGGKKCHQGAIYRIAKSGGGVVVLSNGACMPISTFLHNFNLVYKNGR